MTSAETQPSGKYVVWCLDFGTTKAMGAMYEGDSNAILSSRDILGSQRRRIHVLKNFPDSPVSYGDGLTSADAICPTSFYAEPRGTPFESYVWGFSTKLDDQAVTGKKLCEDFKTKLGPRKFEEICKNKKAKQTLREELETFLWLFHVHAKNYYMGEEDDDEPIVDVRRLDAVVITVPSCFKPPAIKLFRSCVLNGIKKAGLVDGTHQIFRTDSPKVIVLPEPEAAMQTYFAKVDRNTIEPGSFISLLDLGGGTTDAANVVAVSLEPQILQEDRPSDVTFGTDHGGQTLNDLFAHAADAVLRATGHTDEQARLMIVHREIAYRFNLKKAKLSFEEDYTFALESRVTHTIPKDQMMAIRTQVFEPILRVIKEVLERIQDSWAFARAKERNGGQSPQVQFIITGGFSRNRLLRQFITKALNDHPLDIKFHKHSGDGYEVLYGAICRVATLMGRKPTVWPRSIGLLRAFPRDKPYLDIIPPHIVNDPATWETLPTGEEFSKRLVMWFVKKGDPIQQRKFPFTCVHALDWRKDARWVSEMLYVTENTVNDVTTMEEAEANGAVPYYHLTFKVTPGMLAHTRQAIDIPDSVDGPRKVYTIQFEFKVGIEDNAISMSATYTRHFQERGQWKTRQTVVINEVVPIAALDAAPPQDATSIDDGGDPDNMMDETEG